MIFNLCNHSISFFEQMENCHMFYGNWLLKLSRGYILTTRQWHIW
jgi:hypothetical protein